MEFSGYRQDRWFVFNSITSAEWSTCVPFAGIDHVTVFQLGGVLRGKRLRQDIVVVAVISVSLPAPSHRVLGFNLTPWSKNQPAGVQLCTAGSGYINTVDFTVQPCIISCISAATIVMQLFLIQIAL